MPCAVAPPSVARVHSICYGWCYCHLFCCLGWCCCLCFKLADVVATCLLLGWCYCLCFNLADVIASGWCYYHKAVGWCYCLGGWCYIHPWVMWQMSLPWWPDGMATGHFSFNSDVVCRTSSHIWGRWYITSAYVKSKATRW